MVSRTKYKVKFYDTDLMKVIHHSNYIRWFEIGRVELLRKVGVTLGEMMDDGYVFPITEVEAKFHHPGTFDDELIIETTPTALTKVKMEFDYRIIRMDGDKETVLVTGHTQNVYTSMKTGRITRLPEKYMVRFAKAMEDEKE